MDISGFQLKRSRDDLFKNDYEMLNVFQINETVDSLQAKHKEMGRTFAYNSMSKHQYYQAINYANDLISDSLERLEKSLDSTFSESKIKTIIDEQRILLQTTWADSNKVTYRTAEMTAQDSSKAYKFLKSHLETRIKNLEIQINMENAQYQSLRKYEIEFHRKFALSFSIILLFFIGAPLGAIVKRGGFGAPVVIAALLFMVYFILISIGEGIAKEEVVSPFLGMWGPSFILTPFAIFLMLGAANDKSIGDIRFKFWKRKKQK
jgi:lipopolysaccharide export system permease protein